MSSGIYKLKEWRLPEGTTIPLDRPFRAVEIGLPGPQARRLKDEGFLRIVRHEKSRTSRTQVCIWEATDQLKNVMR